MTEEMPTVSELITEVVTLRGRVTDLAFTLFGGRARELAMTMTALDEARLWLVAHGEAHGSHQIVDRAKLLREAAAIGEARRATETTDTTLMEG